jgi:hypothetical protein
LGSSLGGALALALVSVAGCVPSIPDTPPGTYLEMQFDPTASPPKVPQPTVLGINSETGKIDLSAAGTIVPANCATAPYALPPATPMAVAACEFDTFLQSLDGFPTIISGTAPVSGPLDSHRIAVPGNLFVHNHTTGVTVTELQTAYFESWEALKFDALKSWDLNSVYTCAVRGYVDAGVRGMRGEYVSGSLAYFLLKKQESLTCGAVGTVPTTCPYYQLLAASPPAAGVSATLEDLETVRQQLNDLGVWTDIEEAGGIPREEIAIAWSFPTHSASVVELMPPRGIQPQPIGTTGLSLRVKGSIDATTLKPDIQAGDHGSVLLVNLIKLLSDPNDPTAFPEFTVTYAGGSIMLTTTEPLGEGYTYGIVLTDAITNASGVPIVPSPLTVMLRASDTLLDAARKSVIRGVGDTDATTAELGRKSLSDFVDFLEDDRGITRPHIAYLYGFEYRP